MAKTNIYGNNRITQEDNSSYTIEDTLKGTKSSGGANDLSRMASQGMFGDSGSQISTDFGLAAYEAPKDQARDKAGNATVFDPSKGKNITPDMGVPSPYVAPNFNTPGGYSSAQTDPNYVTGQQQLSGNVQTPGGIAQKYTAGFEAAKASGIPAPSDGGTARTTMQGVIPQNSQPTQDTSVVDSFIQEDKGFQQIKADYTDYYSPDNQKKTLIDTYNTAFKDAGLDKLDADILDAETIIEGTEDDIRNEIQQAGGFGTDSQIQAMALSRNKSLLKNYNKLVSLRESKTKNLNTMMSLEEKDRDYADKQMDRMFDYETKMQDYRNKFIQNAQDQYNKYEPAQLYAMLADNPRQLAFAEQIMGLGTGGLEKLASYEKPQSEKDLLDLELKRSSLKTDELQRANIQSNLKTDELQRANIRSQINERNTQSNSTGTLSGKPQNATQSAANSYANRLAEANIAIDNLGSKFTGKLSQLPTFNALKSADRQVYEQAQKNFITAVLRRESGASIAPTEFDTARDMYFPVRGDTPAVVAQKAKTRNTVINNFYKEADMNRPVLPNQIIESNGKRYKVGADGETLTEI